MEKDTSDTYLTTPMMKQYQEIRSKLPSNVLLLFRLGDFYELFGDQAIIASKVLGLTLTKRQLTPMAGLPHHAAGQYISRLLAAGYKVAVCDQTEEAKPGKIVRREITKIFTPGTTIEESHLEAKINSYIIALELDKRHVHMAWLEVSTGEFQLSTAPNIDAIAPVISALNPKEIVVCDDIKTKIDSLATGDQETFGWLLDGKLLSPVPVYYFDWQNCHGLLKSTLGVMNLRGYGIQDHHPAIGAAGALLKYVSDNLRQSPTNIVTLKEYISQKNLVVDPSTIKNLEIFRSSGGTRKGSFLDAIDHTVTPMGARMLENYLITPSLNIDEIKSRNNCVEKFFNNVTECVALQESMSCICDIQRVLTRLQNNPRNPRELGALRSALGQLPKIKNILAAISCTDIARFNNGIYACADLRNFLIEALADELPNDVNGGGFIRKGFDSEVDKLRAVGSDSKSWLTAMEAEEQKKTGIKSLKIKYNSNFGYFIEVTKSNVSLVPDHYIRRQTTVGAERYITHELREKEHEILSSEEKLMNREFFLFGEIVKKILSKSQEFFSTAKSIAEIDVLCGWATIARDYGYCKPELVIGDEIDIKNGRHPVVEQMLKKSYQPIADSRSFVSNDCYLSSSTNQIALITGPNMSGKSTYIRQVALIVLMAQIGHWVPADHCKIGIVDRIFSRIGASDDLSKGSSTFMVEMNETANIINNTTNQSLIILDEIGRGTSTYDGLSIAWAVVEHLHRGNKSGPKTLFATHYHELTKLSESLSRLTNYFVAVKEWNDEIIFLKRVMKGCSDRSYGIQVARLAGIPVSVIDRAKEILAMLETEGSISRSLKNRKPSRQGGYNDDQLRLL
ncbi:MAG: DNA mismatch repair protein MutS [Puniceicoccales bacterium]|jgi:DNA mismatch repair protein MutS|nr:DNA mismatch repair protein MutS [Puniceicoccales bacterium]